MYRKLSKKGIFLVIFSVICIVGTTIFFTQIMGQNEIDLTNEIFTIEEIIAENQILKTELLDFVSSRNTQEKPSSQNITIEAGESIAGVSIHGQHTFTRALKLQAPKEEDTPFVHDNKVPSHNAYILVLVGDVVKYSTTSGETKYVIENARIDCFVQTVLLEEKYNSLYIASLDGTKERMVNLNDYKQALNSVDTYHEMLQW